MEDFICSVCKQRFSQGAGCWTPKKPGDRCPDCKIGTLVDARMYDYTENELVIYKNGNSYEIGKIKRLMSDGAFVWYSDGDTAAKTPYDCLHKLVNRHSVTTTLGGEQDGISS